MLTDNGRPPPSVFLHRWTLRRQKYRDDKRATKQTNLNGGCNARLTSPPHKVDADEVHGA